MRPSSASDKRFRLSTHNCNYSSLNFVHLISHFTIINQTLGTILFPGFGAIHCIVPGIRECEWCVQSAVPPAVEVLLSGPGEDYEKWVCALVIAWVCTLTQHSPRARLCAPGSRFMAIASGKQREPHLLTHFVVWFGWADGKRGWTRKDCTFAATMINFVRVGSWQSKFKCVVMRGRSELFHYHIYWR